LRLGRAGGASRASRRRWSRALGGSRIVIAQAATGAILTVAVADGEAGLYRLLDALIGVGVALVFSQFLFSPEPVGLLRRAEAAALADLADGLELTVRALDEPDDDDAADRAVGTLRDMRDGLAQLSRVRRVSGRVARRSAVWRSQRKPLVRERENASQLDLLAGSCLMLARTAVVASDSGRRWMRPSVHGLALALARISAEPGDRDARQDAADAALAVAGRLGGEGVPSDTTLIGPVAAGRLAAADLMGFAGVEPDEAAAAIREGEGRFRVPAPAPAPRVPIELPSRASKWRSRLSALSASSLAWLPASAMSPRRRPRQPANSRTGRPDTPGTAMNSEPARGSFSGSMRSRDVVMNSSRRSGPPNAHAVTFCAGTGMTSSRSPSGVKRCTTPRSESAVQTPPSASTVKPSGRPSTSVRTRWSLRPARLS